MTIPIRFNYPSKVITILLLAASLYVLYKLLIVRQSLDTSGKIILLVASLWNLSRWYYDKYLKSS